jgi:hypothetical protein
MARHAPYVPCLATLLLSAAALMVALRLMRVNLREIFEEAALTAGGYLHSRPDEATDKRLRAVFTEFDRDLSAILGDRTPRPRTPDQPRAADDVSRR